jgi:hypothetical protein
MFEEVLLMVNCVQDVDLRRSEGGGEPRRFVMDRRKA